LKIDTLKATEKVKERIDEIVKDTGFGKVTAIVRNQKVVEIVSEKSEAVKE
jgi:hypothetical protein